MPVRSKSKSHRRHRRLRSSTRGRTVVPRFGAGYNFSSAQSINLQQIQSQFVVVASTPK